ncbi:MAG: opacity protein-like surface antigen [Pseudohongiellaceae bacterium]
MYLISQLKACSSDATIPQNFIGKPMTLKQFSTAGLVVALTLSITPLLHAATEAPSWYSTISAGVLISPRDSKSKVQLGKAPAAITLDGDMLFDGGQTLAVAIGRQGHTDQDDPNEEPTHWRMEVEYWQGRIERSSFDVGALNASLNDSVRARALFGNALLRVWVTEKNRVWLGAGIGYAKVHMPSYPSPSSCACLNSADGDGFAAQVKLIGEHLLSERTALFLQLGYIQVPSSDTSSVISGSNTRHDEMRSGNLAVGLRFRF